MAPRGKTIHHGCSHGSRITDLGSSVNRGLLFPQDTNAQNTMISTMETFSLALLFDKLATKFVNSVFSTETKTPKFVHMVLGKDKCTRWTDHGRVAWEAGVPRAAFCSTKMCNRSRKTGKPLWKRNIEAKLLRHPDLSKLNNFPFVSLITNSVHLHRRRLNDRPWDDKTSHASALVNLLVGRGNCCL